MRGTVLLKLYINLHTERKVSWRYLVKSQLIISLQPWLTKPSEGASGHLVRMSFAGITTESRTFEG